MRVGEKRRGYDCVNDGSIAGGWEAELFHKYEEGCIPHTNAQSRPFTMLSEEHEVLNGPLQLTFQLIWIFNLPQTVLIKESNQRIPSYADTPQESAEFWCDVSRFGKSPLNNGDDI